MMPGPIAAPKSHATQRSPSMDISLRVMCQNETMEKGQTEKMLLHQNPHWNCAKHQHLRNMCFAQSTVQNTGMNQVRMPRALHNRHRAKPSQAVMGCPCRAKGSLVMSHLSVCPSYSVQHFQLVFLQPLNLINKPKNEQEVGAKKNIFTQPVVS